MPIIQEAIDIPEDIMTKLLTGELKRFGSVVRYAVGPKKGQIYKHLDPVDLPKAGSNHAFTNRTIEFVKDNKKGVAIVGVCLAAVAAGTGVYYVIKNREPKAVTAFRSALKQYLDAIRKGKLTVSIINKLMVALDELRNHKDYKKISVKLTAEELDVLVNHICEYTIKLANDNGVELLEDEVGGVSDANGVIIKLQKCLSAQKRIFEEVA